MSDLIYKDDGSPFATFNSAKAKRTRMGLEGLDTNIVEVDGGWALEKKPYKAPKKRIPLGQRNPLGMQAIKKDPNYVYRVVNDEPGRINMFRDAGWEVVQSESEIRMGDPNVGGDTGAVGTPVTKVVGRRDGKLAYLMRIPKEFYQEDQEAKSSKIRERESDLKMEKDKTGRYGDIKISNERRA
jgi:hypothetical protein